MNSCSALEIPVVSRSDVIGTLKNSFDCRYSSPAKDEKRFECDAAVNQTVYNYHLDFTAAFFIQVDFDNESALVELLFDGKVLYEKNVTIADLDVPICVPLPIFANFVKLCLEFSKLKFNSDKECFRAFVSLDVDIAYIKDITIIPPQEFGWNMAACDASVPYHVFKKKLN